MEVLDTMSKSVSRRIGRKPNSQSKPFWNQAVRDADAKLRQARKRVADLESARAVFLRNAAIGAAVPGEDAGRE